MKLLLKIFFCISIAFNIYFIVTEIKYQNDQAWLRNIEKIMGGEINDTKYIDGFKDFKVKASLKSKNSMQKYYFISVWNTICVPCIKEMPVLDSIAEINKKNISYFFVSDNTEAQVNNCLKKQQFSIKNFYYLNDMNDFISGIFNEKGSKNKIYPVQIILDNNGYIKYYQEGAINSQESLIDLITTIHSLN